MTDSTQCPICGRKDIPDYRKGDVTCPSCGCSLKAFRIIDAIEQDSKSKKTIWKPLALAAMITTLLFAILYFTKGSTPTADKEKLSQLEDSIASLNEQLQGEGKTVAMQTVSDESSKVKTEENKEQAAQKDQDSQPQTTEKSESSNEEVTAPSNLVTEKDGKKYYVVKKGDTWNGICKKLYKGKVKAEELARMNGKTTKDIIDINEELLVK